MHPETGEVARDAPMVVTTRTKTLGAFEPHPEIMQQIEGSDAAHFEADWREGKLDIGTRVIDQDC